MDQNELKNKEYLDLMDRFICDGAYEGQIDLVKKFIDSGIDINGIGRNESTALYNAVTNGNYELIKFLLDSGANPNMGSFYRFSTPLHNAIDGEMQVLLNCYEEPTLEIIKLLLDYGADISKMDNEGLTPLDYAINVHHNKAIEYLKSRGAKTSKELEESKVN